MNDISISNNPYPKLTTTIHILIYNHSQVMFYLSKNEMNLIHNTLAPIYIINFFFIYHQ